MTKLETSGQILNFEILPEEVEKGVDYAKKSLPWTFNRMGIQEGDWTWYYRMMKIVVGVTVQEKLIDVLEKRGVRIEKDWTNYRTEDVFDLSFPEGTKLDVKSFNHYPEYDGGLRQYFTKEFLIQNRNYYGSEWGIFFPCLVPKGQINRDDLFIFAIISSSNYMRNKLKDRERHFVITSPAALWGNFLNHKKIIKAREEKDAPIDLTFTLRNNVSLDNTPLKFHFGYEKEGGFYEDSANLVNRDKHQIEGVSALAYIRIDQENLSGFTGNIEVSFENYLEEPVFTGSSFKDLNKAPEEKWVVNKGMFADIYLPTPISLYFIGWITRDEFQRRRNQYPSYAHPATDRNANQAGDTKECGLMFTRSCCFIYPNVYGGGLKNKNYYVVPGDLNIMDEITDKI